MERSEILDLMSQLQLAGMRAAYDEIVTTGVKRNQGIERVIGALLQAEIAAKHARSINYQMGLAKLPLVKELADLSFDGSPINGELVESLASGGFLDTQRNVVLIGGCGVGKSWLSCALAQKACRDGHSVHYARVPRLFADLGLAHGDGRFAKQFRMLTRVDLLILDDWGPDRLTSDQRRDLMEIVEDRYGRGSTLITSQLPVEAWHEVIGEPTFADAILDRLVHNAYRLALDGPSIRKIKADEMEVAESAQDAGAGVNGANAAKPAKGAKK